MLTTYDYISIYRCIYFILNLMNIIITVFIDTDTKHGNILKYLKPNWKPSSSHSISILTNISTQFLLQSLYVTMCVCVCVCVLYVNCFGRTMLYMCIEYRI